MEQLNEDDLDDPSTTSVSITQTHPNPTFKLNCVDQSLCVNAIIGIKKHGKSIRCDSLGVIRNFTQHRANICIATPKMLMNAAIEIQIPWKKTFFCVAWNNNKNDYDFSFIDTLQPTQFYAMISTDKYEWHPICDDYDQLKKNMNESSQKIQVQLKNGETKVLPLYFNVTGLLSHKASKKMLPTYVRFPTVIQQIPIMYTRQYWSNVMKFNDKIINIAFKIPQEIINHLECLQQKSFVDSAVSFLTLISKSKANSVTDQDNMSNVIGNYNDSFNDYNDDSRSCISGSQLDIICRVINFVSLNQYDEIHDINDNRENLELFVNEHDKFNFHGQIKSSFESKQQLDNMIRSIAPDDGNSNSNESSIVKRSPLVIYLSTEYFERKFILCEDTIQQKEQKQVEQFNKDCDAKDYQSQPGATKLPTCIELLVTGKCRHITQCQLNCEFNCLETLIGKTNKKNIHNMLAMCVCQLTLQAFSCSRWMHSGYEQQYRKLLSYVIFEYCRLLHVFNVEKDWKDKDMMYLYHYYLSLFIAMNNYDDCFTDGLMIRSKNSKQRLRLLTARAMLGESYVQIGTLLENDDFMSAARIHFDLSQSMPSLINIPSKLRMLHQCYQYSPCCHIDNYMSNTISVKDFLAYQHSLIIYTIYLHCLHYESNCAKTENITIDCVRMMRTILMIFGCSLDAQKLASIHFNIGCLLNKTGDILMGKSILSLQSMLDVYNGRYCQSLAPWKTSNVKKNTNERVNNAVNHLFHLITTVTKHDKYKKIKLKIKTKNKAKIKKPNKITKATIKCDKYRQNNPKLLLFAACDYDFEKFKNASRNFHNQQTVIEMIQKSNLMKIDLDNLNKGKYLFELLQYYCDGNINLCHNQEIKILFHFYYAQYYQILSSHNNEHSFECDSKNSDSYNKHVNVIINHFHISFLKLIQIKDAKLHEKFGSKIFINYINFLLFIWNHKNLYDSKKNEIREFWSNHFVCENQILFMPWWNLNAYRTSEPESTIKSSDANKNCHDDDSNLDLMHVYTLLMFKMGNFGKAYDMLHKISVRTSKREIQECKNNENYIGEYRDYLCRNDYCLQIDSMMKALEATRWGARSIVTQKTRSNQFMINCNNNHYLISRFSQFDEDSFLWLISLFDMNCRGLTHSTFRSLKMSTKTLRQIRTSLFFFSKRLGTENFNGYNYDRLYWLKFGMVKGVP